MACLTFGLKVKPTPPVPEADAEAASSNHSFPSSKCLTRSPGNIKVNVLFLYGQNVYIVC